MKLKKIASLALAGIMAVSMLAGCKDGGSSSSSSSENTTPATGVSAEFSNYVSDKSAFTFEDNAENNNLLKAALATVTASNVDSDSTVASAQQVSNGNNPTTYISTVKKDWVDIKTVNSKIDDTVETTYYGVYKINGKLEDKAVLQSVAAAITNLTKANFGEKDKADIRFGCENDVDFIFASFVRRASDVNAIRKICIEMGKPRINIIAKIENQEGYDNVDSILEAADGVMVARGDLGVEIPTMLVPVYQKHIIRQANIIGKPAITATHMLDSMTHNPRCTRAEASDVCNAVLDGSDGVMLSAESAAGDYPVEVKDSNGSRHLPTRLFRMPFPSLSLMQH